MTVSVNKTGYTKVDILLNKFENEYDVFLIQPIWKESNINNETVRWFI